MCYCNEDVDDDDDDDDSLLGADWGWKTEGCETNQTVLNQTLVECRCDHATPFAVFMVTLATDM